MGRRIPKSRKHKKLKFVDPCYSGERPLTKKNKRFLPNEPPTQEDYQEVPSGTTEIINLKNLTKSNKLKRKKKKKVLKDEFIIVKADNVDGGNVVKQNKNESETKFFNRLQKMADTAIAEAKVEEKYDIKLVNIDKDGNAEYIIPSKEVSARKQEKRKMYRQKEIEKKKMKMEDSSFDLQKEKIKFGEVVMAPPTFTAKPRKAPETTKPGKKELLLKNVLNSNKIEDKKNPAPLSIKWKDMPSEKRKVIEIERQRAIQMYRMLKNKKNNS